MVHELEFDLPTADHPHAGAVIVVSATNEHGTTTASVTVEAERPTGRVSPVAATEART